MVVQHNMQAINSNRVLNVTTGQQAKSTEKLSSGYKINRAADDAAGLSISEKMRRQMRGLDRASTNASDGVSTVQTAEGALNEVHDMLQRMNELATQAANGTNSQTDRESIQNEIDQLTTEIDRVAETTKFNETMLLKGGDGTKKVLMNAHDAGLSGSLVDNEDGTANFATELKVGEKVSIGGKSYTLKADDGKVATNIKDVTKDINNLDIGDKVVVKNGSAVKGYQVSENLSTISLNTGADSFSQEQNALGVTSGQQAIAIAGNRVAITYTDSEGIEKTYEMEYSANNQWEKITGYNSKTGDSNLSGTGLYDNSGKVTDDELNAVFRSATKMVVTQAKTGETITYGSADTIAKAVEEDTRVGSEVYMTETPGKGSSKTFADIYAKVDEANGEFKDTGSGTTNNDTTTTLGEKKTVKETNEAVIGDDNTITIHDAKKLMAQELKASNEIGVDNKDDVTVAFRKSASDIAQELALNNGDQVTIKKADKDGNDQNTYYTIVNDIKEAANVTVGNLVQGVLTAAGNADAATNTNGTNPGPTNATAGNATLNARLTIRDANGTVTELKAADAANGNWKRVDDDVTLADTDMDNLLKNAIALDYIQDSSKPLSTNNIEVHWRTAEGMRQDVSQLETGNKVKVTDGGDATFNSSSAMNTDTGDIEVKNDTEGVQNFDMKIGSAEVAKALSFNLHVGAEADLNNKIGVDIETMNSKYLGVKGLDVVGKDADGNNINDGGKAATYAIDAIQDAIQKVNEQRSALGAVQNRLEHTINNLDNVVENTTAAESRIRDTDMAEEMVTYSKNNILAQAGQSMLAQANQSTQGALSLLG